MQCSWPEYTRSICAVNQTGKYPVLPSMNQEICSDFQNYLNVNIDIEPDQRSKKPSFNQKPIIIRDVDYFLPIIHE